MPRTKLPKGSVPVTFRLPLQVQKILARKARREKIGVSELVRRALRHEIRAARIPLPPKCFLLALSLCLGAVNLPAQQLERNAPPLPAVIPALPPDPDTLPPPTPLEWESLRTSTPLQPVTASAGALPVPPPQPEAADSLPLPPSPVALFVSGLPDPEPFILATPWVEIWRAGDAEPEFITQTDKGPARVLIALGTPVLVRLLFDPSLTGTPVTVKTSKEVILQPAVEAIDIGPGGECLFQVQLDEQSQGEVTFYSQGVVTVLPLQSVPASMIGVMP